MGSIQTFLGPNGLIYSTEDVLGNVTILWGGTPYFSFNRNDLFSTLLGIAQLDSIHVVHKTICEIFKVSRNTITNVSNIYRENGVGGLLNYHHGAPGVEKALKSFAIKMYLDLDKSRGYQRRILASTGSWRLHTIMRARRLRVLDSHRTVRTSCPRA